MLYCVRLLFCMRRFAIVIGLSALGLLACTGVSQQSGVTIRPMKLTEETALYTYRAEVPQVHGLDSAETQMLVNERLKAIVEREKRIFARDAKSVSRVQTGATLKSGLTVTYEVERADEQILSVLFVVSPHFFGDSNANHFTVPFNYDLSQRREIKLEDVFTGEYLPHLSEVTAERLKEDARNSGTLDERTESMISAGASARAENYDSFSIRDDGVTIHFDPTEVAPYAEGIKQVTLSGTVIGEALSPEGKQLLGAE